eukprot:6978031-Prymnesium_polylepis.2
MSLYCRRRVTPEASLQAEGRNGRVRGAADAPDGAAQAAILGRGVCARPIIGRCTDVALR